MKSLHCFLLLMISAIVGCSSDDRRAAQTDDIRYVVFRYQLDHARPAQREKIAFYYFAIAEKDENDGNPGPLRLGDTQHDPSDALLARFSDQQPPVRKNSELRQRDPEDPKRSVRFRVTRLQWISETEVMVDGGHDDASSAEWVTFTVRKSEEGWRVVKSEAKRAMRA